MKSFTLSDLPKLVFSATITFEVDAKGPASLHLFNLYIRDSQASDILRAAVVAPPMVCQLSSGTALKHKGLSFAGKSCLR